MIEELQSGLRWQDKDGVLMVWAYYDESGEYDGADKLINLSMGGCISTTEKWKVFTPLWSEALAKEGLDHFHMSDFEAWAGVFNFLLPNGERDWEKHKRILNSLLEIILGHVETMVAYGATCHDADGKLKHGEAWEGCASGIIKDIVARTRYDYEQPINLVFDRQEHVSPKRLNPFFQYYDSFEQKFIGSMSHCEAAKLPPLQAADIIAYEMARCQRKGRPERYPLSTLIEGARKRGLSFTLSWQTKKAQLF